MYVFFMTMCTLRGEFGEWILKYEKRSQERELGFDMIRGSYFIKFTFNFMPGDGAPREIKF